MKKMKKLTKTESAIDLVVSIMGIFLSTYPIYVRPNGNAVLYLALALVGVVLVLVMQIWLYRRTKQECSFFAFLYHTAGIFVLLGQLGGIAAILWGTP